MLIKSTLSASGSKAKTYLASSKFRKQSQKFVTDVLWFAAVDFAADRVRRGFRNRKPARVDLDS